MSSPVEPTPTDILVVQGATYTMRITWTDQQATPQPISLANYRAFMQIRSRRGGTGSLLIGLTSEGDNPQLVLEPGGLTGVVDVRVPADRTRALRRDAQYDLFIVRKDDITDAFRLLFGTVIIDTSASVDPEAS